MTTDTKAAFATAERETWETPALVRLDAADAENQVAPAGEGNSGMGMQAS